MDAIIETKNLCKKYKDKVVVDNVNFSIKKGEIFALLGENGAGKTTIIKMLSGLLLPTSGDAIIKEQSVLNNIDEIKKFINVSPQETSIAPNLSAKENLELIAQIYGDNKDKAQDKAKEMLKTFSLSDRANDKAETFSGGMQRRLSLAMALITDPEVLFLDEPTLGLDPQARQELWKEITKLKGEKTIILTTHYLEEADALSDHIGILKQGKLIAFGTSEELKHNLNHAKTVIFICNKISNEMISELKKDNQNIKVDNNIIEIQGNSINYYEIIECMKKYEVIIENITTKESTLDDVYFSFNKEAK